MKTLILGFAIIASSVGAFAQSKTPGSALSSKPEFDAELAKKLGGDKHGMRRYVVAFLKTGPNDAKITDAKERQEIFKGHMSNIGRLADEGKLAMAGPFADPERKYRGLFILAVDKVEDARALAETDPAIKAGIFVVEYLPWFGSASLMATPEIHKKITEPGH
jgi:uncharacterized protein YciI